MKPEKAQKLVNERIDFLENYVSNVDKQVADLEARFQELLKVIHSSPDLQRAIERLLPIPF